MVGRPRHQGVMVGMGQKVRPVIHLAGTVSHAETFSPSTFPPNTFGQRHFGNAVTTPFGNFSRAVSFYGQRHTDFRTETLHGRQIETANRTLCGHAR